MWDGHMGCKTMAKQRVELLQPKTAPGNLAHHQAGMKTLNFKNAPIDKKLIKNIFEHPHKTELLQQYLLLGMTKLSNFSSTIVNAKLWSNETLPNLMIGLVYWFIGQSNRHFDVIF